MEWTKEKEEYYAQLREERALERYVADLNYIVKYYYCCAGGPFGVHTGSCRYAAWELSPLNPNRIGETKW